MFVCLLVFGVFYFFFLSFFVFSFKPFLQIKLDTVHRRQETNPGGCGLLGRAEAQGFEYLTSIPATGTDSLAAGHESPPGSTFPGDVVTHLVGQLCY